MCLILTRLHSEWEAEWESDTNQTGPTAYLRNTQQFWFIGEHAYMKGKNKTLKYLTALWTYTRMFWHGYGLIQFEKGSCGVTSFFLFSYLIVIFFGGGESTNTSIRSWKRGTFFKIPRYLADSFLRLFPWSRPRPWACERNWINHS